MASEIAGYVGGDMVGPDVVCVGASIDSRTIEPGQLFVPIVDARDGHDFVNGALQAGASAYLTAKDPQGGTAIRVADTRVALTALGRAARGHFGGPVIAITGSVGKTSVKDLTRAAVGGGRRTHASLRSFNNELGVPLTLINTPADTEVVIVEMGARGPGHIRDLCEVARPTVGIVTTVGAVHTSEFGTVEAVAKGKAELVQALPADGRAILNAGNSYVLDMVATSPAPVTTYGAGGDVEAHNIELDDQLRPSYTLAGGEQVSLGVHGVHQVSNSLAALVAANTVGVSWSVAAHGLRTAALSPWRMELSKTASGAVLINDAYNANALSTEAALRSLAAIKASRRVAVLGVMAELGDRHDADHQAMAALSAELGVELIAFREAAYGPEPLESFDEIIAQLGELGPTCAVLVKGSRVAGLEALASRLP